MTFFFIFHIIKLKGGILLKSRKVTKKIHRLTVVFCLSVCLIFSAFLTPVPAAAETVAETTTTTSSYPIDHNSPYYQTLDAIGGGFDADAFTQYVYGKILERQSMIAFSGNTMRPRKTYTSNGVTKRTVDAIHDWLFYDCPALFHMVHRFGYQEQTSSSGRVISITVSYLDTAAAYDAQMRACEKAARSILKNVQGNNSLSDAEKALLIHDRLAIWCGYDQDSLLFAQAQDDISLVPPEDYTMYGALVNHTAVCEGYAKAYKYLLAKVGIYSYICASDDINHAWNIVYIDGCAYHVDVTHDDPIDGSDPYDHLGRVFHEHFLISDAESQRLQYVDFGIDPVSYTFTLPQLPTDTRYENAYWRDVQTEITLIDDELYYCVAEDESNVSGDYVTDFAFILTVFDSHGDAWGLEWPGLMTVGAYQDYILFAQPEGIYGYDVKTDDIRQFFDVPLVNGLGGDDHFYVFGCWDGVLTYNVYYTTPVEEDGYIVGAGYAIMSMESTTVPLFDVTEDGSLDILDLVKAKKMSALHQTRFINGCGTVGDAASLVLITRGLLEQ